MKPVILLQTLASGFQLVRAKLSIESLMTYMKQVFIYKKNCFFSQTKYINHDKALTNILYDYPTNWIKKMHLLNQSIERVMNLYF